MWLKDSGSGFLFYKITLKTLLMDFNFKSRKDIALVCIITSLLGIKINEGKKVKERQRAICILIKITVNHLPIRQKSIQ